MVTTESPLFQLDVTTSTETPQLPKNPAGPHPLPSVCMAQPIACFLSCNVCMHDQEVHGKTGRAKTAHVTLGVCGHMLCGHWSVELTVAMLQQQPSLK